MSKLGTLLQLDVRQLDAYCNVCMVVATAVHALIRVATDNIYTSIFPSRLIYHVCLLLLTQASGCVRLW